MASIDQDEIRVVTAPHPFRTDRRELAVSAGRTISTILKELLEDDPVTRDMLAQNLYQVQLNSQVIRPQHWHVVRPAPGSEIVIKARLQGGGSGSSGGGGKNPLRTVAMIAIAVMAPYAAAFAGSMLAGTAIAQAGFAIGLGWNSMVAIGGFALTFGAALLVNALIPPQTPKLASLSGNTSAGGMTRTSPALSITGSRNSSSRYGVIPRIYGRNRVYPPYAAHPFTDEAGGSQYLNIVFCIGYGPVELSDFRIGTTPIGNFTGITFEERQGYADDPALTLITKSVFSDDYSVSLSYGNSVTRETRSSASRVLCEIVFPSLVRFSGSTPVETTVELDVDYRLAGSSDPWVPVIDYSTSQDSSAVTEVDSPNGETYTTYITDDICDGSILGLRFTAAKYRTNGRDGTSQPVWAEAFKVLYRAEGETDWTVQGPYDLKPSWYPGEPTIIHSYAPIQTVAGKKMEFRIQSIWFTSEADRAQLADFYNGAFGNVAPVPTVSYKTPANASGGWEVTAKSQGTYRATISNAHPTPGKYEYRFARTTQDSSDVTLRDSCFLSLIQSYTDDPPVEVGELAYVAMRIKATEQLNGVIDSFNCVAQSLLQTYDGVSWSSDYTATSNPAWAFADVLRGKANKRALADERLDADAIKAWADACEAEAPQRGEDVSEPQNQYWTFNAVFDYNTTVQEALADIASVGRATPSTSDGKFSVVRDVAQSVPIQHFTPRNSWGFKARRTYRVLPHAVRVNFIDPDSDWSQAEVVVFDDGQTAETATKYETLDMFGCTNHRQAWREGRYYLAVAKLRPEEYTISADVENIVCTRGDVVRVTHDVPRFGLGYARITGVTTDGSGNVTAITVDDFFTMEAGANYAVRMRLSDGTSILATPDTVAGTSKSLTFTAVIPAANAPSIGDLAMFGEAGAESVELIVKKIEHNDEFTARITLLDAAPAVHTADSSEVPEYNAQQTFDPAATAPGAVTNLTSTISNTVADRRVVYGFELVWRGPSSNPAFAYQIFEKVNGLWSLLDVTTATTYTISGLERGSSLELAVVSVGGTGLSLLPDDSSRITLSPQVILPDDVENLNLSLNGTSLRLQWDGDSETVASYWRVRWTEKTTGATYGDTVDVTSKVFQPQAIVPALAGTYFVVGVDDYGYESEAPALGILSSVPSGNVIDTIVQDPAFAGAKVNTALNSSGDLVIVQGDFDSKSGLFDSAAGLFDGGGGYDLSLDNTYTFEDGGLDYFDLGQTYTSRIFASLTVGLQDNSGVSFDDATGLFDARSGVFDGVSVGETNVILQVRTTDGDPSSSPTWSAWRDFIIGEYTARGYQFRIKLVTLSEFISPAISQLSVTIDMPDRIIADNGIVTDAAGSSITFTPAFKQLQGLSIVVDNAATGDYYSITSKTEAGFSIRFFDSGGTGISRQFDYVAKGYGVVA